MPKARLWSKEDLSYESRAATREYEVIAEAEYQAHSHYYTHTAREEHLDLPLGYV